MSSPPTRVRASDLQRVRRGIDTRHRAAQPREFLRKQPAPAAHIENPKVLRIVPDILGQDAAHVAQAGRVERALEDVEEAVVLPPRMAEAVVHLVIHWHGDPPLARTRIGATVSARHRRWQAPRPVLPRPATHPRGAPPPLACDLPLSWLGSVPLLAHLRRTMTASELPAALC